MPDPFRHYEGVPGSICQQIRQPLKCQLSTCFRIPRAPSLWVDGPTFLSQLLFYSTAISASKHVPSTGYNYALRVIRPRGICTRRNSTSSHEV